MAASRPRVKMTSLYATEEQVEAMRQLAEERHLPQAAIIRTGIDYAIEELRRLPPGVVPEKFWNHVRQAGGVRRQRSGGKGTR